MALAGKQTQRPMKRTENSEINSHLYGQIIFYKGAKTIQWRRESLFGKLCLENWKTTCRRVKIDYSLCYVQKLIQNGSKT